MQIFFGGPLLSGLDVTKHPHSHSKQFPKSIRQVRPTPPAFEQEVLTNVFHQAGGHAASFATFDNGLIAKLTTKEEINIYQKYSEKLHDVIPKYWERDPNSRTSADTLKLETLRTLSQKGSGKGVIILDQVGVGILEENCRKLDVKIGARTVSYKELVNQGYPTPLLKTACLTITDYLRGSRGMGKDRGFTLSGYNQGGLAQGYGRNDLGISSKTYLQEALESLPKAHRQANLQKILGDLKKIKKATEHLPITFVASSVFIVIDEQNPEHTVVKLIDLAHPIDHKMKNFSKSQKRFQDGLSNLIAFVTSVQKRC